MDQVEAEQQASACAALIMAILRPGAVKHANRRRLIESMMRASSNVVRLRIGAGKSGPKFC
jgi:hypothetical protein